MCDKPTKAELIKSMLGMVIILACIVAWRLPNIILALKS
jgi:hypothetical protein